MKHELPLDYVQPTIVFGVFKVLTFTQSFVGLFSSQETAENFIRDLNKNPTRYIIRELEVY